MSIVTRNPTAFTTPAPGVFGATPVNSPTETGHASTLVLASDIQDVGTSCEWRAFQAPGQAVIAITLKASWTRTGSISGTGLNTFQLDYSLNDGSSWSTILIHNNVNDTQNGTISQSIPASQDISQIRYRDVGLASGIDIGDSASMDITASSVRLEIEVVDSGTIVLF